MKIFLKISKPLAFLAILAALVVPSVSQPAIAQQANSSAPSIPLCVLYTAAQQPGHRTQLLALDLRNQQSFSLGGLINAEIQGLAIDPSTGNLYAVSDSQDEIPGQLYRVDRAAGELTPIGPHGFGTITELAFRWTGHGSDATLWGWVKEIGLIQLNTATGAGTLVFASAQKVSGLSWSDDGSTLYVSDKNLLWTYQEGSSQLVRIANNLPTGAKAIELRSDGLLVGIDSLVDPKTAKQANPLQQARVFIYDPAAKKLVSETSFPTARHFPGFAGLAWSSACGNPSPGGPANIIQSVTLDKAEVCPGENVLVSVQAAHPESPQGTVNVAINGNWGSTEQYVQFTGVPGERSIVVSASTPEGFTDSEETSVMVKDCGADFEFLEVAVSPDLHHEFMVDFEVTNAASFSDQDPTYLWDFGDGQTSQSKVPYASHSYAEAIDLDQPYSDFQATITLQRGENPDLTLTAHKTLTVWNSYALNNQNGTIQPPVEADERLQKVEGNWTGNYKIKNLENEALEFTQPQLIFLPCDSGQAPLETPWGDPFTISAKETLTAQLTLEAAAVTEGICQVELSLSGQTVSGQPVEANIYFQASPNPLVAQPVTDETTVTWLNDIAAPLVPDPDYITDEDLNQLKLNGEIDALPSALTAPTQVQAQAANTVNPADCDGKPNTPNPIGCECVPGGPEPENKPSSIGPLTCAATKEFKRYPANLPNAQKGDIILVPGCSDLIGTLLYQVTPPQVFSHTEIMTSDYYQVTHSTASEDRYMDNRAGSNGSEGVDQNVLKYGWPGVITQSVEEAFNGAQMTDPNGKVYTIPGISLDTAVCPDGRLVHPLVVKPPAEQAQSVRPLLEAAADIAVATTGNAHYRFFAYTDADIAFDITKNAPANLPWLSGSSATVCSQFVWSSLKKVDLNNDGLSDIQLEGQLEESDVKSGAELDPARIGDPSADGLYYYQADERKVAGNWLYSEIHTQVLAEAGWLGDLLSNAADKYGNQLANCFAKDDCTSNNTSRAWQNPGPGTAVSPDNILFWDAPEQGGVYGYSERLVYRSGAWGRVYRWKPSNGTGSVSGDVYLDGDLFPGATVILKAAGNLETATDEKGHFEFHAVPSGSPATTYEIEARAEIDNVPYNSNIFKDGVWVSDVVEVKADTVTEKPLYLLPQTSFRRVAVTGGWKIKDYVPFACSPFYTNNSGDVDNFACFVSTDARTSEANWQGCTDYSCINMSMSCSLMADNESVEIIFSAGYGHVRFTLEPGMTHDYGYSRTLLEGLFNCPAHVQSISVVINNEQN